MSLKQINRKAQVIVGSFFLEGVAQNARLRRDAQRGIEELKKELQKTREKDRRHPVNPYSLKGLFGK